MSSNACTPHTSSQPSLTRTVPRAVDVVAVVVDDDDDVDVAAVVVVDDEDDDVRKNGAMSAAGFVAVVAADKAADGATLSTSEYLSMHMCTTGAKQSLDSSTT